MLFILAYFFYSHTNLKISRNKTMADSEQSLNLSQSQPSWSLSKIANLNWFWMSVHGIAESNSVVPVDKRFRYKDRYIINRRMFY